MRIKYQIRKKCLVNNKETLKSFLTLKKFPVFIGCTDQPFEKDLFFDMQWTVSSRTRLVQLKNLVDPKLIYSKYHSEAVGEIWEKHHIEFSNFILKYCDANIIEIGGGANELANLTSKNKKIKKWTNFEISKIEKNQIKPNKKVRYINSFISNKLVHKVIENNTTFVHSHVLEHLYSPIEDLKKILKFNEINKMIFSVPNLGLYLRNNYTNVINFEHTYLLTEEILKVILSKLNFKIKIKKYYKNHSIFIYARRDNMTKNIKIPNLKKYQLMYKKLIYKYKKKISSLNKIFIKKDRERNFLFGAHIFSQFLISRGLKWSNFNCILDNSKLKKNKRLYGTKLKVVGPQVIKKIKNPKVLLNAGAYNLEIRKQLYEINPNIKIINI